MLWLAARNSVRNKIAVSYSLSLTGTPSPSFTLGPRDSERGAEGKKRTTRQRESSRGKIAGSSRNGIPASDTIARKFVAGWKVRRSVTFVESWRYPIPQAARLSSIFEYLAAGQALPRRASSSRVPSFRTSGIRINGQTSSNDLLKTRLTLPTRPETAARVFS